MLPRQEVILVFNRTRSSNIWSFNGQNLGASVKVANENSLSADDEDEREVPYFTDTCFINIWSRSTFKCHQKNRAKHPFQLVSVDKRNYTIVAE